MREDDIAQSGPAAEAAPSPAGHPPPARNTRGARIGIFRRIAVLRYSRALEADTPEMLAPSRGWLGVAGFALCVVAVLGFWFA